MFGNKNITKISDIELIISYKKSNNHSIVGELFKRYTQFVFLVCMKYLKNEEDSKDAMMQIYEKLFVDLKKHNIANFKSWLHVVTKNFCLLKIRSSKTKVQFSESIIIDDESDLIEDFSFFHKDIENGKEEKLQSLEKAIESLNEKQKKCIEMFYLQEKCYNEIADATGFSLKNVKSFIQNGKRNIKMKLQKDYS
ncbi:MAG: sigma-70 family RNA polymerase sigma factor [Bacteroidetes bacterium]|nr:sigma-70 family RNA polymerase sigma factor [Bacteroidota bacterium]MBT6685663.1 sigma-70 family RNA polymerase sigma factor [Bacteroidota bacterium]MBT7141887.1 sigma-70 family RNA polymerase sigma factor [Bacteroidota bacterium]MBT7491036.1 sigma-70 family RNA polymerase sigma factor [Bacteroidota bacterium]